MTEETVTNNEESSPPKSTRSMGEHIKAVGAYSVLLAFLAIGVTIATVFWSSSNTNLQTDLRRAQDTLAEARAELSQVKSEYAQFRAQSQPKATDTQNKSEPTQKNAPPPTNSTSNEGPEYMEVSVDEGKTATLYGGDLFISLVQTSLEGNPLVQKVIATIGSPERQNIKIDRVDVGDVTTYNGKNKYEIRITAADTFSAKFLVIRKG